MEGLKFGTNNLNIFIMNLNILTREDFMELRRELLLELKGLTKTDSAQNKKYLRSVEVRRMLSISPSTLQKMRIQGSLPFTRIGTTLFYDYEEIVEILNENSSK